MPSDTDRRTASRIWPRCLFNQQPHELRGDPRIAIRDPRYRPVELIFRHVRSSVLATASAHESSPILRRIRCGLALSGGAQLVLARATIHGEWQI
jgi:hypothetical protein